MDISEIEKHIISRRKFLKIGAMTFVTSCCSLPALALPNNFLFPDRHLSFYNTHTGEELDVDYCLKGRYCPETLTAVNHILRDHRTDEITRIDVRLLDQLFSISKALDNHAPFHIISGYRSPATNAMLHRNSSGVAKNSFHVKGRAIDIRLPGLRLSKLKKTAVKMKSGGVGYYPKSAFIHLDTGPVRYW